MACFIHNKGRVFCFVIGVRVIDQGRVMDKANSTFHQVGSDPVPPEDLEGESNDYK